MNADRKIKTLKHGGKEEAEEERSGHWEIGESSPDF
jgi:hypothetical protein